jgi:hypothetical protein
MAVVRLPVAPSIDPVTCEHREGTRCIRRLPSGWPPSFHVPLWVAQGGSMAKFGACNLGACPRIWDDR